MSEIKPYNNLEVRNPAGTVINASTKILRFLGSVTVNQVGSEVQVNVSGGGSVTGVPRAIAWYDGAGAIGSALGFYSETKNSFFLSSINFAAFQGLAGAATRNLIFAGGFGPAPVMPVGASVSDSLVGLVSGGSLSLGNTVGLSGCVFVGGKSVVHSLTNGVVSPKVVCVGDFEITTLQSPESLVNIGRNSINVPATSTNPRLTLIGNVTLNVPSLSTQNLFVGDNVSVVGSGNVGLSSFIGPSIVLSNMGVINRTNIYGECQIIGGGFGLDNCFFFGKLSTTLSSNLASSICVGLDLTPRSFTTVYGNRNDEAEPDCVSQFGGGDIVFGKFNSWVIKENNRSFEPKIENYAVQKLNVTTSDTVMPLRSTVDLNPDADLSLDATTAVSDGANDGQILVLRNTGFFNVTINHGANTRLAGSSNKVLTPGSTLSLQWSSDFGDWLQTSESLV